MSDYLGVSRRLALIHEAGNESETLDRVVAVAPDVLHCDMAGVMLDRNGRADSAAVTDATVRQADRLQFAYDDGPCLAALRQGDSFRIDDTHTDDRWPGWSRTAADLDVRSVLSTPMQRLDGGALGSLNAYASRPTAFGPEAHEVALLLTRHAATAYLTTQSAMAMSEAVDARTLIGQAQGILMQRLGVDSDNALSMLRRYTCRMEAALLDVAKSVVESGGLPPDHADRPCD